jgi:hypothetical protein
MNSEFLHYSYSYSRYFGAVQYIITIAERGKTRKLGHENKQRKSENTHEFKTLWSRRAVQYKKDSERGKITEKA